MRNWITFLMTLLVGSCVSYANAENNGEITLEAGYRCDDIRWSHRTPSSHPVFETHTKLKDIDIFQIGAKFRSTIGCNLYVRANAYWGWILDGDFKQSISTRLEDREDSYSYDSYSSYSSSSGHDRLIGEREFSIRNCNVVDDKYVYGLSAAIGYPFYLCDCTMFLAPVIGYAFDEQNISTEDEGFTFSEVSELDAWVPRRGSHSCDHKFISRWYGPFVGVDFNYRPFEACWNLFAELEYHWGRFRSRRHSDAGFDIVDHCRGHSRHAHGWVAALGADYDLGNCWSVGFSLKFQNWSATRHRRDNASEIEQLFGSRFGSGSDDRRGRRNHKWHSYAINLTLGHQF